MPFELTIDDTNQPIGSTGTLTVDYTVTNTGTESDTQTVSLDVAPSQALVYRATDLEATLANGDPVTTWPDATGNYDATQGTASAQPTFVTNGIGGNPSVQFDGSQSLGTGFFATDDRLTQPYTWAAVIQHTPTGSNDYVFYGADASQRSFLNIDPNDTTALWAGSNLTQAAFGQLIIGVVDGANSVLRIDGTEVTGNAGSLDHHGLTIGAHSDGSRGFEGLIAELRAYDRRLSADERADLETALDSAWQPNHDPTTASDATIAINYDDYNEPTDVYHTWTGTSDTHTFTTSPTLRGNTSMEIPVHHNTKNLGNSAYRFSDYVEHDTSITNAHHMVDEVYCECSVYFPADFVVNGLTTFRYFFSILGYTGTGHSGGGDPTSGDNGFNISPYVTQRTAENGTPCPSDKWHYAEYWYDMDGGGQAYITDKTVEPTGWTTFKWYIKLNSYTEGGPANADGVVRTWINDTLAFEQTDRRFTITEENEITHVGPQAYYLNYDSDTYSGHDGDSRIVYDIHDIWVGDDIPSDIRGA